MKNISNQVTSKSEIKRVGGIGRGSAFLGPQHKTTRKGRPETEPALGMMRLKVAPHQALHLLSMMWVMAKPAFFKGKAYSYRQILAHILPASLWKSRRKRQMDPNNSSKLGRAAHHFFHSRSSLEKSQERQSNQPVSGYIPQLAMSLPHFPLLQFLLQRNTDR